MRRVLRCSDTTMKALPAIDLSCGFRRTTLTPSRRSSSALSIAPRSPTPAGAYVSSTLHDPDGNGLQFYADL